jgi:hypothetical protein
MMGRGLAAGLVLCAALWLASLAAYQPPRASGPETPPEEFSASRAMDVLRDLIGDGRPHPIGSAAAAVLRARIVQHLARLGVEPQLQTGALVCSDWGRCGTPINIVARLPGTDSAADADSVLLAAHYDSVPAGPGASDDGASVAAVLEIVRALQARPPTRHPIVLLIDEGEEAGLLGAQLFAARHPLARYVKAAVNLDARGTSGASLLFETGTDNAWLIGLYAHALTRALTNSVYYTAYQLTPHATDFSVFRAAGWQGFNFAYIGGVARYHTPLDDLAHADPRSVGQQGTQALAALRALAGAELIDHPPGAAAYFDVFGRMIVRLPLAALRPAAWLLWALAIGVSGLLVRRGVLRLPAVAAAGAVLLGAGVLVCCGGETLVVVLRALRVLPLAGGNPFIAHPWTVELAFTALSGLMLALIAAIARHVCGFWELFAACALCAATLAAVLALWLPAASYLPWVPGVCAVLILLVPLRGRGEPAWVRDGAALLVLASALTVALPLCIPLYLALGVPALPVLALTLVCSLPWLALPLMRAGRIGRAAFAAGTAMVLGVAVIAALRVPVYTAEAPERLGIRYELDATAGRAFWTIVPDSTRLPAVFREAMAFTGGPAPLAPWSPLPAYRAVAPRLALDPPVLRLLSNQRSQHGWSAQLRLESPRGAAELALLFSPESAVRRVRVGGEAWPVAVLAGGWSSIEFLNPPPDGVALSFEAVASAFDVVVQDQDYFLPAQAGVLERLRPAATVPWQNGDVTTVSTRLRLDLAHEPMPPPYALTAQPGTNMRTAAAPMTAVAIQPSTMIGRLTVNGPITDLLDASRMMTTISGTATTPLITALQNSARIGLIGRYWIPSPASTPTAITP